VTRGAPRASIVLALSGLVLIGLLLRVHVTWERNHASAEDLATRLVGDETNYDGLARALLANAVKGVSAGWTRDLDIQGIGYRATVQGKNIEFALGYSHPITFPIPEGITVTVEKQTKVSISGVDRQKVGQVAAEIRSLRPPEPYKGKGIRYLDEVIKKKVGKTGA